MKIKQLKFFPAQEANERVLLVIRRHWFTYTSFWFLAFIMSLPFWVSIVWIPLDLRNLSENMVSILIVVCSAYILLILALLLYGFIDFYLDIYIITDRRIVDIKQNGFFNRTIAEVNLHQVQDVKASVKGFFPTLLHYGEVLVQTAAELENFDFKDIAHPYRISKLIMDLHECILSNNEECEIDQDLSDPEVSGSMQDFREGENSKKTNRINKKTLPSLPEPKKINDVVLENKVITEKTESKAPVKISDTASSVPMEEGKTIKL